jgi:hypothetical protein
MGVALVTKRGVIEIYREQCYCKRLQALDVSSQQFL